jgi:hypothetical protein
VISSRFTLIFPTKKGGGNNHMARHPKSHRKADGESALIQSRIKFNPKYGEYVNNNGLQGFFIYDQTLYRDAQSLLIASNNLPYGFGESPTFAEYI